VKNYLALGLLTLLLFPAVAQARNPSGAPLPSKVQTDSFGTRWTRIGEDNFTVNAPLGSWASNSPDKVVYVGDHGLKWHVNPDGWGCPERRTNTWFPHCYEPSQVLSVHNGMLDYYLHDCTYSDGFNGACTASPGPFSPLTHTMYQTYGRFEARLKFVFKDSEHLNQYHLSWLLWPENSSGNGRTLCGESDFPEEWLSMNPFRMPANAYWHYCPGPNMKQHFYRYVNMTKWHTYTQEWGPRFRRYYIDNKLVGDTTTGPYSKPERWMLQVLAYNQPGDHTRGHLLVDWVWLGKYHR